ncbi:MAG: DUF4065 domain-containing protein [Puniceicoccales bacterium]|jgi:uncharacterized phage-associated protein|nr:DUF4065 domain-containing protein [Puniceicoccales bacterium]
MYDSLLIAQYIMAKCNELKKDNPDYEYNNTKIQKLLYVLYGFYWAKRRLRLTNERPRLWPYGPVFVKVFEDIQKNDFYLDDTKASLFEAIEERDKEEFDPHIKSLGKCMASALSKWSHEEGSPWSKTKSDVGERWNTPIDDGYIEEYFRKLTR